MLGEQYMTFSDYIALISKAVFSMSLGPSEPSLPYAGSEPDWHNQSRDVRRTEEPVRPRSSSQCVNLAPTQCFQASDCPQGSGPFYEPH